MVQEKVHRKAEANIDSQSITETLDFNNVYGLGNNQLLIYSSDLLCTNS